MFIIHENITASPALTSHVGIRDRQTKQEDICRYAKELTEEVFPITITHFLGPSVSRAIKELGDPARFFSED